VATTFLNIIKKKNSAYSVTIWMHKLLEQCNQTGWCTNDDQCKYQDLSNMLYSHAKQAEKESKKVGAHSWSWMLAAAGQTVQYANKGFWCWKNHKFIKPGETNESAFTQAKQNQADIMLKFTKSRLDHKNCKKLISNLWSKNKPSNRTHQQPMHSKLS
jgi:hypothetical protein